MAGLGLYPFLWAIERPVFAVAVLLTLLLFIRFWPLSRNRVFAIQPNPGLGIVRVAVVFSFLWFLWVLSHGAAAGIVGYYTWMYAFLAVACMFLMGFWRPMLGIYQVSDVVERGNLAAALTLAGFVLGTAFAFGGALTGEDYSCLHPAPDHQELCDYVGTPYGYGGWFVVLVFFLMAYFELRANMKLVHRYGGDIEDGMRLDRDTSAGLLLGAVALASGLVSGRAAAGDFFGWKAGFIDYFQRLWPIVLIPVIGTATGRISAYAQHPMRVRAIASAALVGLAAAYFVFT